MRHSTLIALLLTSAVVLQPASSALARSSNHERDATIERVEVPTMAPAPRDETRASRFTSDAAAREIQRLHGGRVLAVQADGMGYRVKVLKNGEVRIYQVDP